MNYGNHNQIRLSGLILPIGLTAGLFFLSVVLINSQEFTKTPGLPIAVTLDLLVTIPILYFLMIRKKKPLYFSTIPVMVSGVLLGKYFLPESESLYLNMYSKYFLPVFECGVFGYVVYKIRKAVVQDRNSSPYAQGDFISRGRQLCNRIFPKAVAAIVLTELSVLYYTFLCGFGKKRNIDGFSYHKRSGNADFLLVLTGVIAMECLALHMLIVRWNPVLAWVLTGLSTYTLIQFIAFARSIRHRRLFIENRVLTLPHGMMSEIIIPIEDIISIEEISKTFKLGREDIQLALFKNLETPNLVLKLKHSHNLIRLYGFKRNCKTLFFQLDKPADFITYMNSHMAKVDSDMIKKSDHA